MPWMLHFLENTQFEILGKSSHPRAKYVTITPQQQGMVFYLAYVVYFFLQGGEQSWTEAQLCATRFCNPLPAIRYLL